MSRLRLCLILTLALLLVTASLAGAAGNVNPGILPPDSRMQGMTYGEWSALYWKTALEIPCDENPICGNLGPNCFLDRSGNVGLAIAGVGTNTVQCAVPAGMNLFLLVLASECSTVEPPPFYGGNEEELRECALAWVPSEVEASIDGMPVQNLSDYLVLSPVFEFTLPEGNFLGLPGGTAGQSISYGTWLMLTPFTPGEHAIHLEGAYPNVGTVWDWTFNVTVTPGP